MKTFIKHAEKQKRFSCTQTIVVNDGQALVHDLDNCLYWQTDRQDGIYHAAGFGTDLQSKSDVLPENMPEAISHKEPYSTLTYSRAEILDALEYVAPAMSDEARRYYLNGIAFNGNEIVATDGHRMHVIKTGQALPDGKMPILHKTTVKLLIAALKEKKGDYTVKISFADSTVRIDTRYFRIVSKLIDGTYPDYRRVIPEVKKKTYKTSGFNFKDFKAPIDAIKVYKKQDKSFSHAIVLNSALYLAGKREQFFPVGFNLPSETGFDPEFLYDTGLVNGTVYWQDSRSPLRIESGDKLAVIMPLRV